MHGNVIMKFTAVHKEYTAMEMHSRIHEKLSKHTKVLSIDKWQQVFNTVLKHIWIIQGSTASPLLLWPTPCPEDRLLRLCWPTKACLYNNSQSQGSNLPTHEISRRGLRPLDLLHLFIYLFGYVTECVRRSGVSALLPLCSIELRWPGSARRASPGHFI